ncbi:ATP-dependent DNA helicase [Heracleum sosnowskyi]|uniref:ATP-dependent DNA helicase n=1 Tax=Heracleum sosnowskyi TaxID=360622 RepID=A0AAD8MT54_9APIA|nr:ATP-dependent DNA helicase [Heracleum sosnowskyi]
MFYWRSYWRCLCEDVVYQQRGLTRNNDLQLSDNQIQLYGLAASIDDVITSIYDGLENSYKSTTYLGERAILTPTNQVVDHLNDLIMDKIPVDPIVYYSSNMVQDDGTSEQGNSAFPIEYLNKIKISGNNVGAIHLIRRLDMCPSDTKLPFNFVRKQFRLQVCFAMTINKAQGQSLSKVGLYLPKPVFCHGQLYVAISRVTSAHGLKVYIETDHGSTTTITKNVVFEEIFYKLPTR